jgi:hypothetical protein
VHPDATPACYGRSIGKFGRLGATARALTAFLRSDQVTEDANPAVTIVRHIVADWVSDAEELRHPMFAHGEHKAVGRPPTKQTAIHPLRRSVGCRVVNHRAIVSDPQAVCLSARPKMAGVQPFKSGFSVARDTAFDLGGRSVFFLKAST